MAKYKVKHSCEHVEVHELFGPEKDRQSKIKWLGTTICKQCWMAEQVKDCEPIEMTYSEYKNKFANCKTKKDSYNAKIKTIVVYVPKQQEVKEEPKLTVEEVADILIAKSKNVGEITSEQAKEMMYLVKNLCDENGINPKELETVINRKKGK